MFLLCLSGLILFYYKKFFITTKAFLFLSIAGGFLYTKADSKTPETLNFQEFFHFYISNLFTK